MDPADRRRILIGFLLLVFVAVMSVLIDKPPMCQWSGRCPTTFIVVKGLACGSKQGLLANPDVQRILREHYQIDKPDCQTAQSEVCRDKDRIKDQDFIWPGGLYWVDVCRKTMGRNLEYDVTFSTPIVFYSWDCVADELVKRGQVRRVDDVYYIPDMPTFVKTLMIGAKWEGQCGRYTRLLVIPTEPSESASGVEFFGLLASSLNSNEVVNEQSVERYLPDLRKYRDVLGELTITSGVLFPLCVKKGMGACPMFTVYESQGIDFVNGNPDERQLILDKFRFIYPQPTVWADHPIIALTPAGKRFMEAMKDREIQKIAWKNHGFRTASIEAPSLGFPGIPKTIDVVIPSPSATVLDRIKCYLKAGAPACPGAAATPARSAIVRRASVAVGEP